jgi:hypothetical protein
LAWLPYVTSLLGVLGWNALGALVVSNRGIRRWAAITMAAVGLGWPLLAPDLPWFRFLIGLGAMLGVYRIVDMARARQAWPIATRLALVWLIPDVREAERAPVRLDAEQLIRLVGFAALGAAAIGAVISFDDLEGPARLAVRWSAGLVACYCAADAASALVMLVVAATGHTIPRFHRDPALARTVSDFWGARWNRLVHDWLTRHTFRPAARRFGIALGIAAAFVGSALLHVYLAGVAGGWVLAALWGAYFLLQGVFAAIEHAVRWTRRPPRITRPVTLALMLASSPLFVEPMLRIVGL